MMRRVFAGSLLAAGVALAAARTRLLTRSGAFATVLVGGPIMSAGRFSWSALTLLFFLSSSGLSRRATAETGYVEKHGA